MDARTAEDLIKAGKLPEAEGLCRKILEKNPEDTPATYLLGCIAGRSGNFEHAAQLIERAVESDPENSLYKLDLAGTFLELGRIDDAQNLVTALAECEPRNEMAQLLLGHTFARQGNLAAAHDKWFLHMSLRFSSAIRSNDDPPDHPFNTDQVNFPDYDGERLTYVICATPRCGSTLLGDLLLKSGDLGAPHEYMNFSNHGPGLAKLFGLDPDDPHFFRSYFDALKRYRTSPNGVFGLKTHFFQFEPLIQPPLMKEILSHPKFVQLLRRNRVAQAVSFSIASQTQRWNSTQEARNEPRYIHAHIDKCLNDILSEESKWMKFFQIHGIDPHILYYEDLVSDSPAVCREIAAFLGVDTDFGFELAGADFDRLSDGRNADWEKRYRNEKRVF